MSEPLVKNGKCCELTSPTAMPAASAFLWNRKLVMQVNCRGFVTAQHMQPEPAKYSHAPNIEAQTFIQPEQPFYSHHPGRFVYIRDDETGEIFSVPHEPVRRKPDSFCFSAGSADIAWRVRSLGIEVRLKVSLPCDDPVELWILEVRNAGEKNRRLSIFPFFTIGYMSWMNQSAAYDPEVGGIVASSVTPYQKLEDYERISGLKDLTVLLHDRSPEAWEAHLEAFEGEGGLHSPEALQGDRLSQSEAIYETPAAVLQYRAELAPGESTGNRFLFGPAHDKNEVLILRETYFGEDGFEAAESRYRAYLDQGNGCLEIDTPDAPLDAFTNRWLNRQVYYHGSTNRLSTDPQTRNYLQDAMGMVYIQPQAARVAILTVLGQQEKGGALPDGILLSDEAELKYINQVPHTDHCVWLPICLQAYLDETGDYAFLDEVVPMRKGRSRATVFERTTAALYSLAGNRDDRNLSLIAQGDWCDPMNMVGPLGQGVSGWLSIATVHALDLWAGICRQLGKGEQADLLENYSRESRDAVQKHIWAGDRYARGITDEGRIFGTAEDDEGSIYLNPQSWALMAGIANEKQAEALVASVSRELETPFGPQMLAPAYTHMHKDIGRLTQKFPGSAENGSIYNHAAAFYILALYRAGQPDHAWDLLSRMLPGPDEEDLLRRGQLPVFIPNYYRGAVELHPRTAGRSSQLFNTGTASWIYRILVEELFGLKGCPEGLSISPSLPCHWDNAAVTRHFRGARFHVKYRREGNEFAVHLDDNRLNDPVVTNVQSGAEYHVEVVLPAKS